MIVVALHRAALAVLAILGLVGLCGYAVIGIHGLADALVALWLLASLAAPVLGLLRARTRPRAIDLSPPQPKA